MPSHVWKSLKASLALEGRNISDWFTEQAINKLEEESTNGKTEAKTKAQPRG